MPDPNMELAYLLSRMLASDRNKKDGWWMSKMASEFANPATLASFIDKHDKIIARNVFKIYGALQNILTATERDLGLVLRLWSGCISGAKLVALKTRDGPVTKDYRKSASDFNDMRCRHDPVWKVGYQAGPALKKLRKESVCYDGVSKRSCLRHGASDAT